MKNISQMLKNRLILAKLSLLFLVGISNDLFAQDFELFKFHAAYYPTQAIEDSSESGEIGYFEWAGQLTIPQLIKNKQKTILLHRLGYVNLQVDTEGNFNNTSIKSKKYYHTVSYNMGLIQPLSSKWIWILNLNPTLASDFEASLNEDDLLFQGNTLAVKNNSEKVKYGFGLAYNTRFGRQIMIPLGMFKYRTPKLSLDALLPVQLSILFNTPNEMFYYGIEVRLNGGFFNNTSSIEILNTIVDETGYSRFNIGPTIAVQLKSGIKITLAGGVSAGRRLDFIAADEEVIDRTPETGPFLTMGVSFTPNKKVKTNKNLKK